MQPKIKDVSKIQGFSDLPLNALQQVTKRFQEGKIKYDRGSHLLPVEVTAITDSIFRHLIAYLQGEDIDTGTTTSHLTAIACNALLLEEQRIAGTLIDNRLATETSIINEISKL